MIFEIFLWCFRRRSWTPLAEKRQKKRDKKSKNKENPTLDLLSMLSRSELRADNNTNKHIVHQRIDRCACAGHAGLVQEGANAHNAAAGVISD
jgi:hypothetical protein